MERNFESDTHALQQGMLWGYLLKLGVDAVPEVDVDNNYTDVLAIDMPKPDGTGFWTVRVRVLAPDV